MLILSLPSSINFSIQCQNLCRHVPCKVSDIRGILWIIMSNSLNKFIRPPLYWSLSMKKLRQISPCILSSHDRQVHSLSAISALARRPHPPLHSRMCDHFFPVIPFTHLSFSVSQMELELRPHFELAAMRWDFERTFLLLWVRTPSLCKYPPVTSHAAS